MIPIMTETIRNVEIIERAIVHWDRTSTDRVRAAYKRIIEMEERETGKAIDPKGHVQWLDGLSCGVGIHVMHKKDSLQVVVNEMERNARCGDDTVDSTVSIESFDPSIHFIIVTEPSLLSYLAEPVTSHVDVFGNNAMAFSPVFKCSVLWWNV